MLTNDKTWRLDSPELASSYLFQARIIQKESGMKLVGESRISPEAHERIERFVKETQLPAIEGIGQSDTRDLVERLLTKFEAICYRRRIPVPSPLISQLCYNQLVSEFSANVNALTIHPSKLVVATVNSVYPLHIALRTPPLDQFLAKNHWLLERALVSYSGDPVGFLLTGHQRYVDLTTMVERRGRKVTEEIRIRLAFSATGGTVAQRLKTFDAEVGKIMKEDEFSQFYAKARSIVEHALSCHGTKARNYLRTVKESVEDMKDDERFAALKIGTLFAAAVRKPNDAPGYLLAVLAQEERIKGLLEKSTLRMNRKELRDLCLRTPTKARMLEQALRNPEAAATRIA